MIQPLHSSQSRSNKYLRCTTQGCFLVKRITRIRETRRCITAGFSFMKMWVEDDVRATSYGDADCFRIAPAVMADRDPKLQPTCLKNVSTGTWRIDRVF